MSRCSWLPGPAQGLTRNDDLALETTEFFALVSWQGLYRTQLTAPLPQCGRGGTAALAAVVRVSPKDQTFCGCGPLEGRRCSAMNWSNSALSLA
jgi:hypothetical protein